MFLQACAESSWIQPTALNTRLSCTAKIATVESTDLKAMDLAVALDACPWIPVLNSKTPRRRKLADHLIFSQVQMYA